MIYMWKVVSLTRHIPTKRQKVMCEVEDRVGICGVWYVICEEKDWVVR